MEQDPIELVKNTTKYLFFVVVSLLILAAFFFVCFFIIFIFVVCKIKNKAKLGKGNRITRRGMITTGERAKKKLKWKKRKRSSLSFVQVSISLLHASSDCFIPVCLPLEVLQKKIWLHPKKQRFLLVIELLNCALCLFQSLDTET